jgi:hypothetical protein
MIRTIFVLAAAPLICAAASAAPIAPLTEIRTPANKISQVYPHHHRQYPYQYYGQRHYWDPRPYGLPYWNYPYGPGRWQWWWV